MSDVGIKIFDNCIQSVSQIFFFKNLHALDLFLCYFTLLCILFLFIYIYIYILFNYSKCPDLFILFSFGS